MELNGVIFHGEITGGYMFFCCHAVMPDDFVDPGGASECQL